jgi:hypothetical protein
MNGSSWVKYVHDAEVRRTESTDSSGAVRPFLIAPTPEHLRCRWKKSAFLEGGRGGNPKKGYKNGRITECGRYLELTKNDKKKGTSK